MSELNAMLGCGVLTMNMCKDCAFWRRESDGEDYGISNVGYGLGLGECTAAKMLWDVTEWDEDGNRTLTSKGKETNVFLQDGSDYWATMATKLDFGCVSWRSKI